jgi:hypothetical protein
MSKLPWGSLYVKMASCTCRDVDTSTRGWDPVGQMIHAACCCRWPRPAMLDHSTQTRPVGLAPPMTHRIFRAT